MLKRFSHFMLFTKNLRRAVDFYTKKLGFKPDFVVPGEYASLRHARMGLRLDLHGGADSGDVGHGSMPYFQVANMAKTLAALKAKGIKVSKPKREGDSPLFAAFWDSEGNALGLEEEYRG